MRKAKPRAMVAPSPEQELTRWSCSLFGNKSEIDVFVESTGKWETAAEVHAVGGFDAEDIAAFITQAIAAHRVCRSLAKEE
jgi:hypothetical protein